MGFKSLDNTQAEQGPWTSGREIFGVLATRMNHLAFEPCKCLSQAECDPTLPVSSSRARRFPSYGGSTSLLKNARQMFGERVRARLSRCTHVHRYWGRHVVPSSEQLQGFRALASIFPSKFLETAPRKAVEDSFERGPRVAGRSPGYSGGRVLHRWNFRRTFGPGINQTRRHCTRATDSATSPPASSFGTLTRIT